MFYDADGMSGDQYVGDGDTDVVTYEVGGSFDFTTVGADLIDASVEWVGFTSPVTATGTGGTNRFDGSAGTDILNGGAGTDWLVGNSGTDTLLGGADNDRLHGGADSDVLRGGTVSDFLSGGDAEGSGDGAADTFFYMTSDLDSLDRIQDFELGLDKIGLDAASFGLAAGTLDADRFYAYGDTITETGSVFVYRDTDGALFWDADGSGAGGLVAMTYLTGNPALTNADLFVV